MDKRQRERVILRMVYDESKFADVRQRESPDFSLRYASVDQAFGVEVTELYYTESDARAKNIARYTTDLLEGADHRHRDDVDVLKVVKVNIFAPDGTEKASHVPAVVRDLPPVDAYARKLARVIARKSARAADYTREGLSHVNLIVMDRENRLSSASPDHLFAHLFVPEVLDALCRTPFREVYFVTRVNQNRRVYVPLRMILLLSELFLFDGALKVHQPNLEFSPTNAELMLFAEFAHSRGVPVAVSTFTDGQVEVLLGNSGVRVTEQSDVGIYDHADFPLPPNTPPDGTSDNISCLDADFADCYDEFRRTNVFASGLAFNVRVDAPI